MEKKRKYLFICIIIGILLLSILFLGIILEFNKQKEFDDLYEKSREALVIKDIFLEMNETFEFKFAVKENDMFLFRYETYQYGMLFTINLETNLVVDTFYRYTFTNFEYHLHEHFDFFIEHTAIITCSLTHIGNKWENQAGHVDLFIIVYDPYFPPTEFPNLN